MEFLLIGSSSLLNLVLISALAYQYYRYKKIYKHYLLNPRWETQLAVADMLSGSALFRIERIPPEDIFVRRASL